MKVFKACITEESTNGTIWVEVYADDEDNARSIIAERFHPDHYTVADDMLKEVKLKIVDSNR